MKITNSLEISQCYCEVTKKGWLKESHTFLSPTPLPNIFTNKKNSKISNHLCCGLFLNTFASYYTITLQSEIFKNSFLTKQLWLAPFMCVRGHIYDVTKILLSFWTPTSHPSTAISKKERYIYCLNAIESSNTWQVSNLHTDLPCWRHNYVVPYLDFIRFSLFSLLIFCTARYQFSCEFF